MVRLDKDKRTAYKPAEADSTPTLEARNAKEKAGDWFIRIIQGGKLWESGKLERATKVRLAFRAKGLVSFYLCYRSHFHH
jgi:hypothetical protein